MNKQKIVCDIISGSRYTTEFDYKLYQFSKQDMIHLTYENVVAVSIYSIPLGLNLKVNVLKNRILSYFLCGVGDDGSGHLSFVLFTREGELFFG